MFFIKLKNARQQQLITNEQRACWQHEAL